MVSRDDLELLETAGRGWQPMGLPAAVGHESYVSGDPSGRRWSVRYFRDADASSLIAKTVFGPETQGPPGHPHGGSTVRRSTSPWALRLGCSGIGRRLPFKACFRLARALAVGRARVIDVEGRKVGVKDSLTDGQHMLFVEGDALFVTLDPARFGPLAVDASRVFGGPDLP